MCCSVLPPKVVMHDAYIGSCSENNINFVVHDDLGQKKWTTRYILPCHWLYEWFSQFHSCGTYSVLSWIYSIVKALLVIYSVWIFFIHLIRQYMQLKIKTLMCCNIGVVICIFVQYTCPVLWQKFCITFSANARQQFPRSQLQYIRELGSGWFGKVCSTWYVVLLLVLLLLLLST